MKLNPCSAVVVAASIALLDGVVFAQPAPKGAPREGEPGELKRLVASDAGSADAPLLFCIGMHIEPSGATVSQLVPAESTQPRRPDGTPKGGPGFGGPGRRMPSYHEDFFFRKHCQEIRAVATIVEKAGGRLTVQAQTPFTSIAVKAGEKIFGELERRGHEVGFHFHEDAHLGRSSERLPPETWAAVMQEEIALLKQGGATRVRYWSGGNLYPGLLDAATRAGLDVMSDHKNPRQQKTDARLLAIHPWRPAGGPGETDLEKFTQHDAKGEIVYLPDGIFARLDHAGMRRSAETGGDWGYFDSLTEGLELSLRAARADRVNVFHFTIHAGEFRGNPGMPFAVIETWLREVLAPLVKARKVRWATFSEMADAYSKWEKSNAGVDPRGPSTKGVAAGTKSAAAAAPSAPAATPVKPGQGFMTFAVNTHDWRYVDESADTLLRLLGIFEKHHVRGDFYFTATMVDRYAEKRPEVIERLKRSNMTISYHVRAPHPLWKGFDGPLRGLEGEKLAAVLRDYETYQLDLTTGGLRRDRPGGYTRVAQAFGRKPVAVGASDASPPVHAAAAQMYAGLGAKVGVFYHESGTALDRPFVKRNGLLERPSDFSITRFSTLNNPRGNFWWNVLDSPRAAEFDPLRMLSAKLAGWKAPRAPFITALIHENNFYNGGAEAWALVYYTDTKKTAARQPPFDLNTPDDATPRPPANREAIFRKYEEMVAYASEHLNVVTSEDIARMAEEALR